MYPVGGAAGLELAYGNVDISEIMDGGPNNSFKYVRQRVSDISPSLVPTGFYWVIVPDLENPLSEFYRKQCGDFDPDTQTGYYISGAKLRTNVERHESGPVQSHHSFYVIAQGDINNRVEKLVDTAQITYCAVASSTE